MKDDLQTADNSIRVILDTNLWISFLIGRQLNMLLDFFADTTLELVSTPILREEILTVAKRQKFRKYFSEDSIKKLAEWMDDNMTMVNINGIPHRCRDPKDDYLLELAVQAKAIYLVSGDDDLLTIGEIEGCRIMTFSQFALEWSSKQLNKQKQITTVQ